MSDKVSVEELYPLVTEAILRAETLEDLGAPGAARAYLDVSLLEEKITEALSAADPEGAIARRGAVRAALTAHERGRAQQLAERFLSEADIDEELRNDLIQLAEQAELQGDAGELTRLEAVLRRMNLPTRDDISSLAERIDDLYRKLETATAEGVVKTGDLYTKPAEEPVPERAEEPAEAAEAAPAEEKAST